MERREILQWLHESDAARLEHLWRQADAVRRQHVGDDVHLRGLVEISNHCVRRCAYCGLRADHTALERYRMTEEEILDCAHQAVRFGYGTLVLQAGEDPGLTADGVGRLIQRIKHETPLAVTLSLGERSDDELLAWRRAGADRYLLRFETSDRRLFDRIHPAHPGRDSDRIALLGRLREMGYEVGSGVMVGIPGQTRESLADDIEMFRTLDLDMIGVGPFLPHPATPLGHMPSESGHPDQVPNTEQMTYVVMALARLACPRANIPSTTALATLNRAQGRELGLQRGANIVMPNLTPPAYRCRYEIYPAKACLYESAEDCHGCLTRRIRSIGRRIGAGPGTSPNYRRRGASAEAVACERGIECPPHCP